MKFGDKNLVELLEGIINSSETSSSESKTTNSPRSNEDVLRDITKLATQITDQPCEFLSQSQDDPVPGLSNGANQCEI